MVDSPKRVPIGTGLHPLAGMFELRLLQIEALRDELYVRGQQAVALQIQSNVSPLLSAHRIAQIAPIGFGFGTWSGCVTQPCHHVTALKSGTNAFKEYLLQDKHAYMYLSLKCGLCLVNSGFLEKVNIVMHLKTYELLEKLKSAPGNV